MSTQNRNSGGGRNQKKANAGGGGGNDSVSQTTVKKTDHIKPEKEKSQPKPTAEQLRIAQITNSNTAEDPQIREKVATLIEMTQRSEEEVCCALNECDNNLEHAVVFLLETLPVGAFETSSKKKKKQAANAAQESSGGDGDWADSNANDRREKSRNRSSNRGGRGGGGDSRGWRGREGRENDRNIRESRGDRGDRNDRGDRRERIDRGDREDRRDRGDREDRGDRDDRNDSYRGNRSGGRGGRGGYVGRGGRGGRGGGGRSFNSRGDRGGNRDYRTNQIEDHQEVELWDNTIAQNAEKQQQTTQDDAWGDWDNEEYVGSLKDSKVFTSSTLGSQAVVAGVGLATSPTELSAPPGLEQHLGTSVLGSASVQQQGSHLNAIVGSAVAAGNNINNTSLVDDSVSANSSVHSAANTPLLQYSAAVSNNQLQQQQQNVGNVGSLGASGLGSAQFNATADTFSNAASAAATLVQQVQQQQQQQTQIKSSATLSAEQSQYFNSLSSQGTGTGVQQQQQQPYGQNSNYSQTSGVQYPTSYANVFGSAQVNSDQSQLTAGQQTQVRRARAKLPPPSKIPASAVEMPGDTMNNMGYIDVQFGALDFNNDDSFETAISDKFSSAVTIDGQAPQKQSQQELVANDYQNKSSLQQQNTLTAGLQESLTAATSGGYAHRGTPVQQQQVSSNVSSGSVTGNSALDQLTKNDPYNQANTTNSSYQNTYQSSSNKSATNAYQPSSASAQSYNSSSYTNVQTSAYSQQSYGAYPQNSYQQQTAGNAQNVQSSVSGNNVNSSQNIPVGGNASSASVNSNTSSGYLSSSYQPQQGSYPSNQSVYGSTGLSNSSGYPSNTSNSTSQYSNFSTSGKLKETGTTAGTSHYESVSGSSGVSNTGQVSSSSSQSGVNSSSTTNTTNNSASNNPSSTSVLNSTSGVSTNSNSNNNVVAANSTNNNITTGTSAGPTGQPGAASNSVSNSNQSTVSAASSTSVSTTSNKSSNAAAVAAAAAANSGAGTGGMVPPNIQMVSQYIQTGMPYYQQPVYSFEELQMMQQRVPHVQGYYDLNYTPTSLGTGRDNMGSVAYSTMTDGRFARTDNNSSPVSSTMSQQAGSGGHMLNVPYAYFYNANAMMPGSFQYGTHTAIYPQIPAANTASGGQFPKPSYNAGYGSASYDTLSQASQDYNKGAYQSSVSQQAKSQNVANPPQAGTGSDISTSMYGKGHVALNKVNSYEKQNFHSGTPPPFNMANTQAAGGTSAQPYGMYLPMPATGHHNMMHQQIHQDSNSTGQRQQTTNQSKPAGKQGYSHSPSYWTAGQN